MTSRMNEGGRTTLPTTDPLGRARIELVRWSLIEELPGDALRLHPIIREFALYLTKAKLLYQQCMSKDDQDCVVGFVDHHLAKELEESDVVHDLLAFLAEEILRLNKEKRALQKTFLAYFVDGCR